MADLPTFKQDLIDNFPADDYNQHIKAPSDALIRAAGMRYNGQGYQTGDNNQYYQAFLQFKTTINVLKYTTAGTYTYTPSRNCLYALIQGWGGGGAGSNSTGIVAGSGGSTIVGIKNDALPAAAGPYAEAVGGGNSPSIGTPGTGGVFTEPNFYFISASKYDGFFNIQGKNGQDGFTNKVAGGIGAFYSGLYGDGGNAQFAGGGQGGSGGGGAGFQFTIYNPQEFYPNGMPIVVGAAGPTTSGADNYKGKDGAVIITEFLSSGIISTPSGDKQGEVNLNIVPNQISSVTASGTSNGYTVGSELSRVSFTPVGTYFQVSDAPQNGRFFAGATYYIGDYIVSNGFGGWNRDPGND